MHTTSTVIFSLVCMVMVVMISAIHIELLSDDKPCSIKNPTILMCTYDLNASLPNGDPKYSSSQPSWRENGKLILLTDPRYHIPVPGLTSAMLHVNITWEGPVEYSCFLLVNDGFDEEESNKIMVIHKDKPDAPKLNSQPVITDNSITLQMTHNKTCFIKHNFFLDFNVTVNSEKMYNNRTGSIEESITIQNLEPGTEHNISVVAVCEQDDGVRSKIFATTIKTTSVANAGPTTIPEYAVVHITSMLCSCAVIFRLYI